MLETSLPGQLQNRRESSPSPGVGVQCQGMYGGEPTLTHRPCSFPATEVTFHIPRTSLCYQESTRLRPRPHPLPFWHCPQLLIMHSTQFVGLQEGGFLLLFWAPGSKARPPGTTRSSFQKDVLVSQAFLLHVVLFYNKALQMALSLTFKKNGYVAILVTFEL